MLSRIAKELMLDKAVTPNEKDAATVDVDKRKSCSELLGDIKFGCAAVFSDSALNELPTKADIEFITDRSRSEGDSNNKLKGNVFHAANTLEEGKVAELEAYGGVDFDQLRKDRKKETEKPQRGERTSRGGKSKRQAVERNLGIVEVPDNQIWCQHCGDGGELFCCESCPISAHKECCRTIAGKGAYCSHHFCNVCFRTASAW